jgi:8-hydroxy-5-deazaflavin:NADPH oxidoreductase
MRIAVLGGTGPAGGALALRLADVGHQVRIGSRSAERAAEVCAELTSAWPERRLDLEGSANEDAAAWAELAVVATPWDAAAATAADLADRLAGKVVISMANAMAKVGRDMAALVPPRGSIAAAVQAALPQSKVAGAFHHVPAHELGRLGTAVECDVIVCADDPETAKVVSGLIDTIPGLRAVRAGNLTAAAATEAFTAVLLQINRRYKTRTTIRLHGLEAPSAGP